MDKVRIQQLLTSFNNITHSVNNESDSESIEIWFARELQFILGYARWENFIVAINRAVDSCKTQGSNPTIFVRSRKWSDAFNLKRTIFSVT